MTYPHPETPTQKPKLCSKLGSSLSGDWVCILGISLLYAFNNEVLLRFRVQFRSWDFKVRAEGLD